MKFSHYILMSLGLLALTNSARAQDSLFSNNTSYLLERNSLLNELRFQGTAHAALRQYRYQFSGTQVEASYSDRTQDIYNPQQGSGQNGLTISTRSFLRDFFANTTVWGQADYNSSSVKSVRYNESLDYERIFPYFLADSIGGDIKMERYHFGGGIVRSIGKWNVGSELNIDAKQNYRSSDPRPNNNSTALGLSISISRPIHLDYLLSFSVDGELFKEQNVLKFVGNLGMPLIINLNGLGTYNNLLTGMGSGSSAKANFLNKKIGTSIQLAPIADGLWLSAAATHERGDKTVPHAYESINNWEEQNANLTIGYDGKWNTIHYMAMLGWATQHRKGSEGLFSIYSEDFAVKRISETSSYRYYNDAYTGSIAMGIRNLNVRLHGAYQELLEQYASPFRMQRIQQSRAGIDLQYFKQIGRHSLQLGLNTTKTFTLNSDRKFNGLMEGTGISDLLNNNFDYLTRDPFYVQPSICWSLPTLSSLDPYIAANAYHASDINQKGWEVKIGLVF